MNILITAFKAIIVFFLAFPTLLGLLMARSAWRSRYYIAGEGTVFDAKITESMNIDNEIRYSLEITMIYIVEGKMYQGTPSFSSSTGRRTYDDYLQELRRFSIGNRHTIYFDPVEPETYTLQANSSREQCSCAALVLIPSLAAIAAIIWGC